MKARGHKERYDHHRGSRPLLRPTSALRTGLFLVVNLTGYAVVNAFWQYLATGRWLNLRAGAYWPDRIIPLGRMFVEPLSVLQHPWMILVTGLLLGVIVFVPIVVGVLYRLLYAAAFVVVVALLGHAPMLAAALAVGCALAGRTPLRSDLPLVAAVLGLVPVGLYLYFLGFAGVDSSAVLPLQRWVFYGPVFVAIVSAVLASAIVLALAAWTGFRPGVVWPVMVALLAVPMVIFYTRVGPAQLDYAVLINRLGPGRTSFRDMALSEWIDKHAARGLNRQTQEIRVREDLEGRKRELIDACDAFLLRRPAGDRVATVLWIRAWCMGLQLDERAFDGDLIRCSAAYPLEASRGAWRQVLREAPASPQAALARWRLGELALRRGRPTEAEELLNAAAEALREIVAGLGAGRNAAQDERIFLPVATAPAGAHYRQALVAAERLLWLIRENDALTDASAAEALAAFVAVNVRRRDHYPRITDLARDYEGTKMEDNLKLAAALGNPNDYEGAAALIVLAERKPPTDAAIEANYELGQLAMQEARAPALQLLEGMKTPQAYFKAVLAARPNPWQLAARRRLDTLTPTTRPKAIP